jgi:hypothetical protein
MTIAQQIEMIGGTINAYRRGWIGMSRQEAEALQSEQALLVAELIA